MGLTEILKADYANLTDKAETKPDLASQTELSTLHLETRTQHARSHLPIAVGKSRPIRDTIKELRTKELIFS
jgi:excinuclease ABC subunit B